MKASARDFARGLLTIVLGAAVGACSGTGSTAAGPAAAATTTTGAGGVGPTSGAGGSGGAVTTGAAGATNAGGGGAGAGGEPAGGAGGEPDAGAPTSDGSATDANGDAGAPAKDAAGSNKILVYAVTTGFRHTSIPAACRAIATAVATSGLTTDEVGCSDATNKVDATKFTSSALAQYGAVVMLANSGEPIGYPATQEIQNLVDYVQHGGALVAIEDATHCYDGTFNGHPASQPYIQLMGGDFTGHPGDVSPATCTKVGTHVSVAQLPMTFTTTDEVYSFSQFRMDNTVVLRCTSSGDPTRTVRPVSWIRDEGAGRFFYTALGHLDASWTGPQDLMAANSRLVEDHILPGLIWTMRR